MTEDEAQKKRGRPVTTGTTPKRGIRIPDETWLPAVERAREQGTSAGELCREFLDYWLRKPGAKLPKRPEVLSVYDLAAAVSMESAPEKVAQFAGCLTPHDPRTGRLPKPWHGKGMDATFTRAQYDQLIAEWDDAAAAVEDGFIEDPYSHRYDPEWNAGHDARVAQVQERFQP